MAQLIQVNSEKIINVGAISMIDISKRKNGEDDVTIMLNTGSSIRCDLPLSLLMKQINNPKPIQITSSSEQRGG